MRFRFEATALLLALILSAYGPIACTSVPGAPTGDDAYEEVSANEALEEEMDREVSADIDR